MSVLPVALRCRLWRTADAWYAALSMCLRTGCAIPLEEVMPGILLPSTRLRAKC